MKNTVLSRVKLLFTAALVASTLLFASCDLFTPKGDLNGTWESSYGETYSINKKAKTFDAGEYSYAGSDLVIEEFDDTCGTVFFKYTRALENVYADPNDTSYIKVDYWMNANYDTKYTDPNDSSYTKYTYWYRYSETAPDVGKWYAVSYKDLTKDSVSLSGAFGAKSSCETLEEAKKEFTIENKYFAYYSDCTKSK